MKKLVIALGLMFAMVVGYASAQVSVSVGNPIGWQYHDNHWNYYDNDDRAWYYTDGSHWYTYGDGGSWNIYNFDRNFGRTYVRQGYVAPRVNVTLPRHRVNVHVR